MDFADVAIPGLGRSLKHIAGYTGEDNDADIANETMRYNYDNGVNIDGDASVAMWRLLKRVTEGAPLALVLNTKNENGIRAWIRIPKHFLTSLEGQQGQH